MSEYVDLLGTDIFARFMNNLFLCKPKILIDMKTIVYYLESKKILFGFVLMTFLFIGLSGCGTDDDGAMAPDISLNKENLVLEIGTGERLIASFNPPETPNTGHTWSSSAANIASVDETGMVMAVSIGEAVITATALDGGKKASCKVTVTSKIIHVTNISLNIQESSIAVGEQLQLEVYINPENASDKTVSWNSSDNTIAQVDKNGLVTALAPGEVNIIATSNDGNKQASCKLTIDNKGIKISKAEVSNITPNSAHITGHFESFGIKIQEKGICYANTSMPTIITGNKIEVSDENISHTLTGLSLKTTYYVRLYAIVEGEVLYGEENEFITLDAITTQFKATQIYEDKLVLVTPAPIGIDRLNICYGTTPNPTITDNTSTATLNNEGLFQITLEGLQPGTDYYIRAYNRIDASIEYYDGETSAQTIGKDFKANFSINKYGMEFSSDDTNRYVIYRINCDIDINGTYLVESTFKSSTPFHADTFGKSACTEESIYISNGNSSFLWKMSAGIAPIASTQGVLFNERYVSFTNIETGTSYYICPTEWEFSYVFFY